MSPIEFVKTTCPRDCYDACGIAVARREGTIVKVLGDPEHAVARGALCGKCAIAYNGAWRDRELRLAHPLKRIGRKGTGQFVAVSWAEALGLISAQLRDILNDRAAHTILHTHYTGTVGLIGGWYPLRFFHRLGATEVDPDTVCNKAGHAALELVFGTSLEGFDPRTAKHAKTILIWGANPSSCAPHQNKGWLRRARETGVRVIVVDPIGHDTSRAADLHLQLRPGSDAVLAFAMLNVLREHRLLDAQFIQRHVLGAEELTPQIEAMTVERAVTLCGVPATSIIEAALAYGHGPSLLWLGQGVQRQPQGGNIVRAVAALVALSGNLGKAGAGFLYMNGPAARGVDLTTLTLPALAGQGSGLISHMDLAATLEDPARARALFTWNNNPAASSPDQSRLRRALQRESLFHVAVELFHTDTTAYADVMLPAASFLECDDLVLSYFDLTLSAQVKASEPPGEALPNSEIFRCLAQAMGFVEPELFESDVALLERLLRQTPYAGSFSDLARCGTVTVFDEPVIQFSSLRFATPSGRIELASERAVELGLPRIPGAHVDSVPAAGRLRLLSPASPWQMNSTYGNDLTIVQRLGPPRVLVHPHDALQHGVQEGDAVVLYNERGELPLAVAISEAAQPGVVIVHKGRWPAASAGNANVNVLTMARKCDIGQSTSVHGTEVQLRKVGAVRPHTPAEES